MKKFARLRGTGLFAAVTAGQLISTVGSSLSTFALGVWIFQQTGQATPYALIMVFTILPGLIAAPFAGVAVDRWDRRRLLIGCEVGMCAVSCALFFLLAKGVFSVWNVYAAAAINSILLAFTRPAYAALVPLLVSREKLGNANGIAQLAQAGAQILSPALAGVLVTRIQIEGVLLVDAASFLLPIGVMFFGSIPAVPHADRQAREAGPALAEFLEAWRYLAQRQGLVALLVLFAILNFVSGTATVLAAPLVLAFASPESLGLVLSVGGIGMLLGSIVMSIWGGPAQKVKGILFSVPFCGACLALAGLRPSLPFLLAGAFGFFFGMPICGGCAMVIWQSKIALEMQGRLFALSGMVSAAALPLASLLSGPLADRVFNPLLMPGGLLAPSLGRVIGAGPGRGIGAIFILAGLLMVGLAGFAYLNRRLRWVEQELPDVVLPTAVPLGEPVQP